MKTPTILFFLLLSFFCNNHLHAINIQQAEKYIQNRNFKQAITIYSDLINIIDTLAPLYYGRGLAHYYDNQYDNAIADFNKAITIAPTLNEGHLGLAICYIENEQYKTAISNLNKIIAKDSTNPNYYYCRAIAYYLEANYTKALNDFTKVQNLNQTTEPINKNQNITYALYGQAITNYKLKNFSISKEYLETLLANHNLSDYYESECQHLLF